MLAWELVLTLRFYHCTPLVERTVASHHLRHLVAKILQNCKQIFSPLHAVKFLFASVIYKESSRTGKQTKENNVSINASKETCVANGFSETVGSEGVTLPLH